MDYKILWQSTFGCYLVKSEPFFIIFVLFQLWINATCTHSKTCTSPILPTKIRVPTIFCYWNSRTFKDPEVAFSRTNSPRKFTAWTVLQRYLISISVITEQWLSRTCGMKFKDFQAPVLFSSTFSSTFKNSSTFKDFQVCVVTLWNAKTISMAQQQKM